MNGLLKNRQEAGQLLANCLTEYAHRSDVLVLALPRGGVPVGFEIAQKLHLPLDIWLVRKLGVPGHQELAMGAIAPRGIMTLNQLLVDELKISESALDRTREKETKELERREKVYRGDRPLPVIKDQIIILVDDGIATGATLRAAITSLKEEQPQSIIVAVPIASAQSCQDLEPEINRLVCLKKSDFLASISRWYEDFSQVSDQEVCQLLAQSQRQLLELKSGV